MEIDNTLENRTLVGVSERWLCPAGRSRLASRTSRGALACFADIPGVTIVLIKFVEAIVDGRALMVHRMDANAHVIVLVAIAQAVPRTKRADSECVALWTERRCRSELRTERRMVMVSSA